MKLRADSIRPHVPIMWLIAVFLLAEAFLFHLHAVPMAGQERDGIGYMARATGPFFQAAPYHGPAYTWAIRIVSLSGLDAFAAAKITSILFGAVLILASWLILLRLAGRNVAMLGSVIIAFNHIVLRTSVMILSDMMAAALFWVMLALFILPRDSRPWQGFLAGVVAGLAYLTRYVYIFLLVVPLGGIVWAEDPLRQARRHIKKAAFFVLGFALIVSPWCFFLYRSHGNPFWNQLYHAAAFSIYENHRDWDLFPPLQVFSSLKDVVLFNPRVFFLGYLRNLKQLPWHFFALFPGMTVFGVIGFLTLFRKLTPQKMFLLTTSLLYALAVGIMWFVDRYYLPFIPLAGAAMAQGLLMIPRRVSCSGFPETVRYFFSCIPLRKLVIAAVLVKLLISAVPVIRTWFHDQAPEYVAAARRLATYDLDDATILASRPHIPYFCDIDKKHKVRFAEYRGEDIRMQFVDLDRFPEFLKKVRPRYFIYDERFAGVEFPQYKVFLAPSRNPYPQQLEFLFEIPAPLKVVVYRYNDGGGAL